MHGIQEAKSLGERRLYAVWVGQNQDEARDTLLSCVAALSSCLVGPLVPAKESATKAADLAWHCYEGYNRHVLRSHISFHMHEFL